MIFFFNSDEKQYFWLESCCPIFRIPAGKVSPWFWRNERAKRRKFLSRRLLTCQSLFLASYWSTPQLLASISHMDCVFVWLIFVFVYKLIFVFVYLLYFTFELKPCRDWWIARLLISDWSVSAAPMVAMLAERDSATLHISSPPSVLCLCVFLFS